MKQPSTRLISAVCILLSVVLPIVGELQAQTVIGGTNGNPSAVLELRSNDRGLLLPRLTSAERSAIASPAEGLVIYNTTEGCVEINLGSSASPDWNCLLAITGRVVSVDCEAATQTGTLTAGVAASDVSTDISYTGGNGSFYKGQTVTSTGVTGLTATLAAGTFVSGSGSVTYTITGTPSGSGTASFALSLGGQSCTLSRTVSAPEGVISSLNCGGATNNGSLVSGQSASGVSSVVTYTGGNGGTYSGQTVSSTGVTGLTATLVSGTLASSSGSLTYTITGTPSGSGTASFALSLGGQSCTLSRTVSAASGGGSCGAFVASGVWKEFMCHNLGANTSADPFTPSWELNGNYYQWGRKPTCFGRDGIDGTNPCSSPVYGAAAPWGNTTANDNAGVITGWSTSTTAAPNGAWADGSKTANDPCPAGWRVPTAAQWNGVINNTLNPRTSVGTWTESSISYTSGYRFGQSLFLPAAGGRVNGGGSLGDRGSVGFYWSSTVSGSDAQFLYFNIIDAGMVAANRALGFSLRCVAE